ncbi:Lipopolysaccharide core heptosyltransferase RfaQ [Vibrio aerogenes CECT 7868]|uniref:Lipopolysaccharide core heptosyltransferase RfaQ n=1 Tax=Vibrio aerogenes CECT 7868 TaxID=1216006 RepID=A0A1M5ZCV3_9VIBR|nr:glycosyltransferase family 9 protein [Vibrio aerogenes]SHI22067.1 Lipopolysaccharide core heptosyltransferase RfaQ [Vibrio aerogenes CECT 7868]
MALFQSSPRSICILRLSAIGDVCNAVAAVQAIQRYWPETRITWITGKLEAQLISDLPGIEVIIFDKKQGWHAYKQVWQQLKEHRFDALLHMQYAIRASILTLGIKARYKLGFDATRSQDFQTLFTNVKVPSPAQPHVLDGFLAFAQHLGVKDISPTWNISYSAEDKQWAEKHLDLHHKNLVIVAGASKKYKNWIPEGYARVLEHATQSGWNIILAGSPSATETQLADDILRETTASVTNLVGESSIKQMLALIDLADLLIAPDTGPTHMANAMKTPVIGLYAHHNPARTGPYHYRDSVISVYEEALKAEQKKEISQLSWRTRVKDEQAMKRIKADDVIIMFERISQQLS